MQAEDNFLTQMNDELSRRDTLLNVVLIAKEKLAKDIESKGILPCSNHKTVEFKTL